MHPKNEERADWALLALDPFAVETFSESFTDTMAEAPEGVETDAPDMIADLICDLCHLAKRHALDPRQLLDRGWGNYEWEARPDYDGD